MSYKAREDLSSPLRQENSNLSDYTVDSTSTFVNSPSSVHTPGSPVHHRTSYRRLASFNDEDTAYHGSDNPPKPSESLQEYGLGIKNLRPLSVPPQTVVSSPSTPCSVHPLSYPPLTQSRQEYQLVSDSSKEDNGDWVDYPSEVDSSQPFVADSETEGLRNQTTAPAVQTCQPPEPWCKAKATLQYSKGNWLGVSILILSVYSTILSGLWLGVAIVKPRFGHSIAINGGISPFTASLVATAIAKSIELSFVTVFVTFLGQVLSRRALVKQSKGITISEMSMRSWVMQPGTLITHFQTVRHTALTLLGLMALTGALVAMLYTTASESLVTPKLKMGPMKRQILYGKVATSFANEKYIEANCKTPISDQVDSESGPTCIAIEHSGQAYHNYMQYLSNWTQGVISSGQGSDNLAKRPIPVAMLYDNTTIEGSWIDVHNMTEISKKHSPSNYSRTVINITMAMPHAGVFDAMRNPNNKIMQPQDLEGLGQYHVQASVPSPVTNVLCASMQKEELAPMVFSEWPNGNGTAVNLTGWPAGFAIPTYPSWGNSTPVDDLFGFGEEYGRRPPVFPKLPIKYNTVLNKTGWFTDSIYILATSSTGEYTMCSLRASLTPRCSTHYHASLSGGSMNAHCEDPGDDLAFDKSDRNATDGAITTDWASVAGEWAMALSLNNGISDANSSNARLLSQLIPTKQALDPSLPSIAEALAVLSGCTLLVSSSDSPFIQLWNYSTPLNILKEPQHQAFNAMLQTKEFASGGTQRWQDIFYIVLSLTFVLNVLCLVYLIKGQALVTDFIEPQNLFSLALNSPPSHALDGACGSGPEGDQLIMNWHIKMDHQREHLYIQNGGGLPPPKRRRPRPMDFEMNTSPIVNNYTKLSSKHSSLL